MSSLAEPTASELSLDFLDDELAKMESSTWMSGSDFDLLLGGQTAALQDQIKDDGGARETLQPASSRSWQGFPSTLFAGPQQKQFGASFDILDHSSNPRPGVFNWQNNRLPAGQAQQSSSSPKAINGQPAHTRPQPLVFSWQLEQEQNPATGSRADMDGLSHSPAKSESGENNGLDIPPAVPSSANGTSPAKNSSWQRTGILKRSKSKPLRQRAQVAQVAELKGQVAELTAKCSSMERALSQQSLSKMDNRSSAQQDGVGSPLLSIPQMLQGQLPQVLSPAEEAAQKGPSTSPASSPVPVKQEPGTQGAPASSLPESLKGMSYEQFGNLYRTTVSHLAVQLGSLPLHKDDSTALERLKRSSSEVLLLVMRCCMENSVAAKLWMQESFKAEQARLEAEKDGGQFWQTTAASLALTNEQKKAVVQLRQAFLHRLEGLQKARNDIIQGLTGSAPSSFRNRASAVAQLGALQKIEAYCANMKECDRLICDFVSSLLSQILTPIQMARCLVAAWPHWPDTLAISTYIAAAAGESSAIGMLRQEFAGVSIAASS